MQVVISNPGEKLNGYFETIKSQKYFLILLFFLISGMLCGAVSVKFLPQDTEKFLINWFKSFVSAKESSGFLGNFFSSFIKGMLCFTVILVASFGVGGLAVIPLVQLVRGIGVCALAGLLYRAYSLEGIAFADLILLPSAVIIDFSLLLCSAKGLELSKKFFDCIKDVSNAGLSLRPMCLSFLKSSVKCVLLYMLASVLEAAFAACFIRYFKF